MAITKVQRVIKAFVAEFHATCVEGSDEDNQFRVSQLPENEQADFWRRDAELHPSSFPFCGLRQAYERYTREEDPVIRQDFSSDYYLNAGTVTHSAFQRWFGRRGKLIGDWQCIKCKRTRKFGPRPKACKCGGIEFEYHELGGIEPEGPTSWHTDGLFKYGEEYWLCDLKTSSMFAIEKNRKGQSSDLPYAKNVFQIESYTVLVEKKYGIKISGWLLFYLPRDKPNQSWNVFVTGKELDDERRETLLERLDMAQRMFAAHMPVRETPIKVFKKVLPNKICSDRDFYNDYIHSPFDECPLQKVCFNRKKLIGKIKQTISNPPGHREELEEA
jgi:hypothetical protein